MRVDPSRIRTEVLTDWLCASRNWEKAEGWGRVTLGSMSSVTNPPSFTCGVVSPKYNPVSPVYADVHTGANPLPRDAIAVNASAGFEFSTASFAARISGARFYQDPVNPGVKMGVFDLQFTHPVEPAEFERRVEVLFPILDEGHRKRVIADILATGLCDNVKARMMHADGISGGLLGDASGPFGNRSGRVAGAFGAEWGQILAKPRGLIGRHRSRQAGGRCNHYRENDGRQAQRNGSVRMRIHGLEVFLECLLFAVRTSTSLSPRHSRGPK